MERGVGERLIPFCHHHRGDIGRFMGHHRPHTRRLTILYVSRPSHNLPPSCFVFSKHKILSNSCLTHQVFRVIIGVFFGFLVTHVVPISHLRHPHCFVLLFPTSNPTFWEPCCSYRPPMTDWCSPGSSSMIDADKTAWVTLCLGCLTHISVSGCVVEIILEQPSHFSRDLPNKELEHKRI